MARPRHPNKEIEAVVQSAEAQGWTVELCSGHAWGQMLCPRHTREGCIVLVYSTPRNPENHARALGRKIGMCRNCHEEEDDEDA